jgi:YfiH family protein
MSDFIYPDWPAPDHVKSVMTTRSGGKSLPPFDSMNLGLHVDDERSVVLENRLVLKRKLALPSDPLWLNQVHGTTIANHAQFESGADADAVVSHAVGDVCAIMTADCLPVLFCNKQGTAVAAAHAGWRGLQSGILEKSVIRMDCDPDDIMVWLGAAISQESFEVGGEVRQAFVSVYNESEAAFIKNPQNSEKWLADIYELARIHLGKVGISNEAIYGGGRCTYKEDAVFFSYRREVCTGRMASLIWLSQADG